MPGIVPDGLEHVGPFALGFHSIVNGLQASLHFVDVPELIECLGARRFLRHALRYEFADPRLEVKAQLVFDLSAHIAAPGHECAHVPSVATSCAADITRATAAT